MVSSMVSSMINSMVSSMANNNFLSQLEKEAQLQAKLQQKKLLPERFGAVASFIARYPWQVIALLSGLTALVIGVS